MTANEDTGAAAAKAIRKPDTEPSREADELTLQEHARLTPTQRATYHERRYIAHIVRDNHRLLRENERLRPIEVEHSKLVYSRGWQVHISVVSGLSVLGSGAIFSQCSDTSAWMMVGWGLLLLAAAAMIGSAIVPATVAKASPPKPESK